MYIIVQLINFLITSNNLNIKIRNYSIIAIYLSVVTGLPLWILFLIRQRNNDFHIRITLRKMSLGERKIEIENVIAI